VEASPLAVENALAIMVWVACVIGFQNQYWGRFSVHEAVRVTSVGQMLSSGTTFK
jgi:hypothetical protein